MSKDDYLLLLDLNSSFKRSLISIEAYIKYKKESSENLDFQKKIYNKYIRLSNSLIDKTQNVTWFEKGLIMIKYFLCSFFKLDSYFFDSFLEKDISISKFIYTLLKNYKKILLNIFPCALERLAWVIFLTISFLE